MIKQIEINLTELIFIFIDQIKNVVLFHCWPNQTETKIWKINKAKFRWLPLELNILYILSYSFGWYGRVIFIQEFAQIALTLTWWPPDLRIPHWMITWKLRRLVRELTELCSKGGINLQERLLPWKNWDLCPMW